MKHRILVSFRKTKKWPNFSIRICVFSGTLSSFSHVSSLQVFQDVHREMMHARCIDIIHTAHLTSFTFPNERGSCRIPLKFVLSPAISSTRTCSCLRVLLRKSDEPSPNWNQEKIRECDNWLARFIVGGHGVSVSGSTSAIKWSSARRRRNGDAEISEKRIKNDSLLLLA